MLPNNVLRPTPYSVVLDLLFANAIQIADAKEYIANYEHFENNRSYIETTHTGRWVAAVDEHIFSADTETALRHEIRSHLHANRAYIEHVGRL